MSLNFTFFSSSYFPLLLKTKRTKNLLFSSFLFHNTNFPMELRWQCAIFILLYPSRLQLLSFLSSVFCWILYCKGKILSFFFNATGGLFSIISWGNLRFWGENFFLSVACTTGGISNFRSSFEATINFVYRLPWFYFFFFFLNSRWSLLNNSYVF